MARNSWSAAEEKRLVALYEEGMKPSAIAVALGRSYSSVYHRCMKLYSLKDAHETESDEGERECLKCHLPFHSHGKGNRICNSCALTNQGYVGVVPC